MDPATCAKMTAGGVMDPATSCMMTTEGVMDPATSCRMTTEGNMDFRKLRGKDNNRGVFRGKG